MDGANRPESGNRQGSFFSRPPMTPLTASDGQAPAEAPEQENPQDTGWDAPSWDRQGPTGLRAGPAGGDARWTTDSSSACAAT